MAISTPRSPWLPQGNEKIQILKVFGLHALKFSWGLNCRDGKGCRAQGMETSQANSSSCLASIGEMQQILDFSGARMWLSGHQCYHRSTHHHRACEMKFIPDCKKGTLVLIHRKGEKASGALSLEF